MKLGDIVKRRSIEDQLSDLLAAEIQKEIDAEIMREILGLGTPVRPLAHQVTVVKTKIINKRK